MSNVKNECVEKVCEKLRDKAVLKQHVYKVTQNAFSLIQNKLEAFAQHLHNKITDHPEVVVEYKKASPFESEIKFSGDTLMFTMHSNIFSFEPGYAVHNKEYVKQDPSRAYCGMIEIYNFLADSFKYNRMMDTGYLIARIFINKEGHFFVEGEEQLGFLYQDFENLVLNEDVVDLLIEKVMEYAIDFDLWAPKYQDVKVITVGQKIQQAASLNHKTGKRVGFEVVNLNVKLPSSKSNQ